MTDRRKLVVGGALLGALLLVAAWWGAQGRGRMSTREPAREPVSNRGPEGVTASDPITRESKPSLQQPSRAASREQTVAFDRAKRDALRSAILQALAEQRPRPSAIAPPPEDEPRPPGQLTDRIGGRDALAKHLNHDFMPLADECIEQARLRMPELEGLLAIGLDTVADADLGGIVESVAVQPDNEIDDPELLECISQTALSMILPPPPESGREQFVITMPIEPEPK